MPQTSTRPGRRLILAVFALLGLGAATSAQSAASDWPQWRGPRGDGVSRESGWDVAGVELWLTDVGLGYSAVAIQGGRLYTIGHDEKAQEDSVFCLDARNGRAVWEYRFPAKTWGFMHRGGTLTTPAVGGDRVFVSNRWGYLLCLEAARGDLLWRVDLTEAHGVELPTWGLAASPMLLDDKVVMNAGVVLAFDRDGELAWKTERDYGASYSTPARLTVDGRLCLAVFAAKGLVIVDAGTGGELGFHEWRTQSDVHAATPVVVGDRVFLSSGYNRGGAMLRFTGEGLERLWASKAMRTHMSGCVHFEGHLYGFDESTFKCLDLDGEVQWTKRGLGKGAFVIAGGRLVIMSSRGNLVLAEATPEEYRELSRTDAGLDGVNWTTPVVSGGRIYCRTNLGQLVCRDHRPGAGK